MKDLNNHTFVIPLSSLNLKILCVILETFPAKEEGKINLESLITKLYSTLRKDYGVKEDKLRSDKIYLSDVPGFTKLTFAQRVEDAKTRMISVSLSAGELAACAITVCVFAHLYVDSPRAKALIDELFHKNKVLRDAGNTVDLLEDVHGIFHMLFEENLGPLLEENPITYIELPWAVPQPGGTIPDDNPYLTDFH